MNGNNMNRAQFFKSLLGLAIAPFVIKEVAENPEYIGGNPNEESGNFALENPEKWTVEFRRYQPSIIVYDDYESQGL